MYKDVELSLPFPLLKEWRFKKSVFHIRYFFSSVTKSTKSPFLEPHSGCEAMKTLLLLCSPALYHFHPAPIYNGFPDRTDVLFRSHPRQPNRHWREAVMMKHSGVGCSGRLGSGGAGRGWSEISFLLNTDVSSGPTGSWWPCDLWRSAGGADQNTAAPSLHTNTCIPDSCVSSTLIRLQWWSWSAFKSTQRPTESFFQLLKGNKRTPIHFVWRLLWISVDYVY